MITSKKDYKYYLERDRIALSIPEGVARPRFGKDEIWRWERLLRKCEYYTNCRRDIFGKIVGGGVRILFRKMSIHLGFTIPLNTFEEGLCIWHYGTITVNTKAKIGRNCRISESTNIGDSRGGCPTIGNNVFICTGAKIFGDISIADDVMIGANSVVNKTISEPGITVAGTPAKKISDNSSRPYLNAGLFDNNK